MPLSKIQSDILRLLASRRDPESYDDIDVFHDREERVALSALGDAETLAATGYLVSWLRQQPLIYTAQVTQGGLSTRLEWVADSDFRFFPTVRDEIFGYMLHPVDLGSRREVARLHAGRIDCRNPAKLELSSR